MRRVGLSVFCKVFLHVLQKHRLQLISCLSAKRRTVYFFTFSLRRLNGVKIIKYIRKTGLRLCNDQKKGPHWNNEALRLLIKLQPLRCCEKAWNSRMSIHVPFHAFFCALQPEYTHRFGFFTKLSFYSLSGHLFQSAGSRVLNLVISFRSLSTFS